MNPAELKEHLEQVHEVDVTNDSILGDIDLEEVHAQDHEEWMGEDAHEHNWARKRLEGDGVKLEEVPPDAST